MDYTTEASPYGELYFNSFITFRSCNIKLIIIYNNTFYYNKINTIFIVECSTITLSY